MEVKTTGELKACVQATATSKGEQALHLAAGTYELGDDQLRFFGGSGVAHLHGAGADVTIIRSRRACLWASGKARVKLQGLTMQQSDPRGAALMVGGEAHVRAERCVLQTRIEPAQRFMHGCAAVASTGPKSKDAGGTDAASTCARMELVRCTLISSYNGAFVALGASLDMEECEVIGCGWNGVRVVSGGRAALRHCRVERCGGNGIVCEGLGSDVQASCCAFSNNARSGAYLNDGGGGRFERNTLDRNGRHGAWKIAKAGRLARIDNMPNS